MNRLIVIVFMLLSQLLTAQKASMVRIRIMVKDSITQLPVENASISINKHHHFHLTAKDGSIWIDSVPTGNLYIHCHAEGYHPIEQFIRVDQMMAFELLLCPESFHIHEIEIHGTGKNDPFTMSTQSRTTLSEQMIDRIRSERLGDMLRQVNGVTLLNTGPTISKPVIRGLHSNRIAILNGGVKQEGQQWGSEHGPELDPFAIQKIEVIRGASSVEFGPEAIGGVIRITPYAFRKKNGVSGEWSNQFFSNNRQYATSLAFEGTHGKQNHLSWLMRGSYRKAGDASSPDYVISNTGFLEADAMGALSYSVRKFQFTGRWSIFSNQSGIMRAAHLGNLTDLQKAITSDKPLFIKPFTYTIGKPFQQVWHEIQSLEAEYKVKKEHVIQFQISRQFNSRQEYDLGVSWNANSITQIKPAYDLGLLTYAADLLYAHKPAAYINGKIGINLTSQSNITGGIQQPIIPNYLCNGFGLYLLEKYIHGRLQLEAGLRSDFRELTTYSRNKTKSIVTETRQFSGSTFILGSQYQLTEQNSLGVTVSSGWRPPSINELYSYGLHNAAASFEVGDVNLKSEQSINLDLSFKRQTSKWLFELNAYTNRIFGFIYASPSPAPVITLRGTFPAFHFIQTDALLQGAEMKVMNVLNQKWTITFNGTYLYALDLKSRLPLIFMPANRASLDLQYYSSTWKKLSNLFATLSPIYVARQSRIPDGIDYTTPPSGYFLLNLNSGMEISLSKTYSFKLGIGINNLLNTRYRDYLNRFRYFSDEQGINLIIRLTLPLTLNKLK